MLNAKELNEKIVEYRGLIYLRNKYNDTFSGMKTGDMVPTVFSHAGSTNVKWTTRGQSILTSINNAALKSINKSIASLESEFSKMGVSLEGLVDENS